MSSRLLLAALALGTVVSGCTVQTDLGRQCFLVKKDANGERVRMTEAEITSGLDFISFGASECENYVCVRDAAMGRPTGATDESDAIGYCSAQCEPPADGALGNPCPAENPAHDDDPALRLTCRSMLLDEDTINLICAEDEALCQRLFGPNRTPFFCARGGDQQT